MCRRSLCRAWPLECACSKGPLGHHNNHNYIDIYVYNRTKAMPVVVPSRRHGCVDPGSACAFRIRVSESGFCFDCFQHFFSARTSLLLAGRSRLGAADSAPQGMARGWFEFECRVANWLRRVQFACMRAGITVPPCFPHYRTTSLFLLQ